MAEDKYCCMCADFEQLDELSSRYELGRRLGTGSYGSVRLARHTRTGQLVALKTIYKRNLRTAYQLQRVRDEVDVMRSLDHPNIIKLIEAVETRRRLVLVLEYAAGGELFEQLLQRRFSQLESRRLFTQLTRALQHCHEKNVVHRDLKLENVLLDEHGQLKLADFGLATRFSTQPQGLTAACGSALYAAPEIIEGRAYHGPEVDCWSLGVLLFTLLHGSMPFGSDQPQLLRQQISSACYYEPRHVPGASQLLATLLQPCTERRATVTDVLNSDWLQHDWPLQLSATGTASQQASQTPLCVELCASHDSGLGLQLSATGTASHQASQTPLCVQLCASHDSGLGLDERGSVSPRDSLSKLDSVSSANTIHCGAVRSGCAAQQICASAVVLKLSIFTDAIAV